LISQLEFPQMEYYICYKNLQLFFLLRCILRLHLQLLLEIEIF